MHPKISTALCNVTMSTPLWKLTQWLCKTDGTTVTFGLVGRIQSSQNPYKYQSLCRSINIWFTATVWLLIASVPGLSYKMQTKLMTEHIPGTSSPRWCQAGPACLTLYVSTSLACGKWNGAMNKRTHSLFTPSRYRLSAMIRATKFLPVPDQPWKESVRGLLDSGLTIKPWMALRTTDWARCCPWSFVCRSFSKPEQREHKYRTLPRNL